MKDAITQKLEQRTTRRGFLRGSGLVAVAVLGTAAFPRAAAQDQEKAPQNSSTADDAEQAKKREDGKDSGSANADNKDQNAPAQDEPRVTLKDDNGREYRVCPECGSNMYRQDSTWTCENCGYSYTE